MSLIELLVGMMMFSLILAAVLSSLATGTNAERGQQARHEALVELRQAMTKLTKELRQAESVDATSDHNVLKITTLVGDSVTPVTYAVTSIGGDVYELRRSVGASTNAVVTNMVVNTTSNPDPPFCYSFDSAGSPPQCIDGGSPPTALTAIRITLAKDPEFNPGEPVTLATDVDLRNL